MFFSSVLLFRCRNQVDLWDPVRLCEGRDTLLRLQCVSVGCVAVIYHFRVCGAGCRLFKHITKAPISVFVGCVTYRHHFGFCGLCVGCSFTLLRLQRMSLYDVFLSDMGGYILMFCN